MKSRCAIAFTVILAATSNAMADEAPAIPPGAKPLTGSEIEKLLHGRTFNFTGYDEALVAVTSWDAEKKTVSGSYVWNNKEKGTFSTDWVIDGDKNCTRSKGAQFVCQTIYPFEEGFMEVTVDGKVHGVSLPVD